jgi:hypothetical protein
VKKNPEKYIKELEAKGIVLEETPKDEPSDESECCKGCVGKVKENPKDESSNECKKETSKTGKKEEELPHH